MTALKNDSDVSKQLGLIEANMFHISKARQADGRRTNEAQIQKSLLCCRSTESLL